MKKLDQRVFKFPNGVTLLYSQHNVNNTTNFAVGFLGGARKDGQIPGTAHFLEHSLISCNDNIDENFLRKFLRNYNINLNGFTSENFIGINVDTPNSKLEDSCVLLNAFLFNRNFNSEKIIKEKMTIEQEILQKEPTAIKEIIKQIQSNTFSDEVAGTIESIENIDEKVLRDYIDDNFVAENMVIAVSSNLEFDKILSLADKYFASKVKSCLEKTNKPVRPEFYYPANSYAINVKHDFKTVQLELIYHVHQTEKEAELYCFVEDFLFNNYSGLLFKKLRAERGLVYGADHNAYSLSNSVIKVISLKTSGNHINEVIEVLGGILKDLTTNGISDEDYKDLLTLASSMQERLTGCSILSPQILIDRYINGREMFFDNQVNEIKNLSKQQINDYLKMVYANKNIILTLVGDFEENNLYSVEEIEKLLGAKKSQLFYNNSTGVMMRNDCSIISQPIPELYLKSLLRSGSVAFVRGGFFTDKIRGQLLDMLESREKTNVAFVDRVFNNENQKIERDTDDKFENE